MSGVLPDADPDADPWVLSTSTLKDWIYNYIVFDSVFKINMLACI